MSFYLSYTNNIKKRKAPHLFWIKDNTLFTLSDNVAVDLLVIDKCCKNPIIAALNYIKSCNISDSEILLPLLRSELLDEACEAISKYLLENDNSIGLLTPDLNYRDDFAWLINKYGITYSIPREKPTCGIPGTIKVSKAKSKPKFASADIFEAEGSINSFKTCAPRRPEPEDDLESGLIMDEPFNTKFVKLLNESGKTNVEVYTKGGITRQVFSNILSKKDFIPRKDTVICLIIGMELNYIDGINLLACAGYALSKSIVSDVVVMKHLKRGEHDLDAINDELDERGCSLLGWKPRDN